MFDALKKAEETKNRELIAVRNKYDSKIKALQHELKECQKNCKKLVYYCTNILYLHLLRLFSLLFPRHSNCKIWNGGRVYSFSVHVYLCDTLVHVEVINDLRNCTILILLVARRANYMHITDMM